MYNAIYYRYPRWTTSYYMWGRYIWLPWYGLQGTQRQNSMIVGIYVMGIILVKAWDCSKYDTKKEKLVLTNDINNIQGVQSNINWRQRLCLDVMSKRIRLSEMLNYVFFYDEQQQTVGGCRYQQSTKKPWMLIQYLINVICLKCQVIHEGLHQTCTKYFIVTL